MTIRDLQYAIQDAIDEKGVDDEAQVVIEKRDGKLQPYQRQTLLGRV